ncbi:hypothetical protein [Demequina sp.]|uniref:hypothetical protein n=1 Tax=Demequina sp. TaxID=2050685 RepID=UPI003D14E07A
MARTSDAVNARKVARERMAELRKSQADREARIEAGVLAVLSAQGAVDEADERRSAAEEAWSKAVQEHERKLDQAVAAFRGEELGNASIASLLGMDEKAVAKLGKSRPKAARPSQASTPTQPSSAEQERSDNA